MQNRVAAAALFAFILLPSISQADPSVKDIAASYPPEMLFQGKPIDPSCVFAASEDRKKIGVELSNKCKELRHDGSDLVVGELVTDNGSLGYSHNTNRNRAYVFYRYLGKTEEGIILSLSYSTGGSGQFSDVSVYKREGNVLRHIRYVAGGDRAWGGAEGIKIENGHLVYSYSVTPLELYQKYSPDTAYRPDVGSGFSNYGAEIYKQDDKVIEIKLAPNALFPDCFKKDYKDQIAIKDTISEGEAKSLMRKLYDKCPPPVNERKGK